ncbi:MAG TPA: phosphoribosylglycinamide formyltransferase [Polyangiaceae bacterium]|nr:phosphoribosylglycinamide formyltransferase [Polyangiaceae bacterium]
MRKQIGVLASHAGTVLQAIIDASTDGRLEADVCLIVSNNSRSGAAQRAEKHQIPFVHLSGQTHPAPAALDAAILEALVEQRADIVFLAGYMKKLGPRTLAHFRGRILNTHPALLPKFGGLGMYGARVHAAVLAAGDRVTGVSVHLVESEYDSGPVLAQCQVPVLPGDDVEALAARVQMRERQFVVETLARLARGERLEPPEPSH